MKTSLQLIDVWNENVALHRYEGTGWQSKPSAYGNLNPICEDVALCKKGTFWDFFLLQDVISKLNTNWTKSLFLSE